MRLSLRREHITWKKSSFCSSGECAEFGSKDGMILIRSTLAPRNVVRLNPDEFRALQLAIRNHEFDELG